MGFYVAIVKRIRTDCGRAKQAAYVHVVDGYQQMNGFDSLDDWIDANPTHPWLNPNYDEYAVEIFTLAEYESLITIGLWYDNFRNLPIWQQKAGVTGSTRDFGSYADPGDVFSVFTSNVQVNDSRLIFRVYDADPVTNPTTAVHIGEENLNEVAATTRTRYIKKTNAKDNAIGDNTVQRLEVGDKFMRLLFGTSHVPSLPADVATFEVDVSKSGLNIFRSDYKFRFIGPDEGFPTHYAAKVYGNTLRLPGDQ